MLSGDSDTRTICFAGHFYVQSYRFTEFTEVNSCLTTCLSVDNARLPHALLSAVPLSDVSQFTMDTLAAYVDHSLGSHDGACNEYVVHHLRHFVCLSRFALLLLNLRSHLFQRAAKRCETASTANRVDLTAAYNSSISEDFASYFAFACQCRCETAKTEDRRQRLQVRGKN